MVNLERISQLRPTFQGDYKVVLVSGDVLPEDAMSWKP
jgi:DNA-binding LytR/AlgR family response regulator